MIIILVVSHPPKPTPAPNNKNDDRLLRELNATLVDPLFYVQETQIIHTDTIYESELSFRMHLEQCTELIRQVTEEAEKKGRSHEFKMHLESKSVQHQQACADALTRSLRTPMDQLCASIRRQKPAPSARSIRTESNWLVGPATKRPIEPIVLFSVNEATQATVGTRLNFTETVLTLEYNLFHVFATFGQNDTVSEEITRSTIYGIYKLGEVRRILEHAVQLATKGKLDAYLYSRLQHPEAQRDELKYQVPIDCVEKNPIAPISDGFAVAWNITLRYPKVDPDRDQLYRVRSVPVNVNNCTVKYVGPPFVKMTSDRQMCYPTDFYVYKDVVVNVPCSETPKFEDLWKVDCDSKTTRQDLGIVHTFPDDRYLVYCSGTITVNKLTLPCPRKPFLMQTKSLTASITNVRTAVEHPTGNVLFSPESTLEFELNRGHTSWRDLADARALPVGIGFLGGLLARLTKVGNAVWSGVKFVAAPFTAFGRAIWNNLNALIAGITGFSIADAFTKIEPYIQWLIILVPIALLVYLWFFRKKPQPAAAPPVVYVPTAPSLPPMSEPRYFPRYY